MADRVIVTVGTKRGLFLFESGRGRGRWNVSGPHLKGWAVNHAVIDTRGAPRLYAAAEHFSFGSNIMSGGITAKRLKPADEPPAAPDLNPKARTFARQYGISTTKRVWIVEPGPAKKKSVLYAGTAPAGLFRTENRGKTWQPVDGLNRHRTRKDWEPGAGGQALHSIQMDPHDAQRMYVAISAAGAFRSDDGGDSWTPINHCVTEYVGAPEDSEVFT